MLNTLWNNHDEEEYACTIKQLQVVILWNILPEKAMKKKKVLILKQE